ncbi:MAG: tripartite tricarboxylate transporter TctB family protein [Deferrisomatales bacterium]|nr:tripartite tricarboxylate transporter TctB family protein [Deferrisomatales bacterium]
MRATGEGRRLTADFYGNLGALALAVYLYVLAVEYPPTARKFPHLVLMVVIGLTSVDTVRRLLKNRRGGQPSQAEPEGPVPSGYLRAGWVVGLMFVFMAFMLLFGFTVGTLFFLLFSIWTLGYRKPTRLILASLLITGFMYAVFILIMNSLLPHGLLLDLV